MKRPHDNTRPDDNRQDARGMVTGTIEGWVYRLIRDLLRRDGRQGTRAMVTGAAAGMGTTVVACLGASATAAVGSYDWIRDLAQRPRLASFCFYRFAEGGDLAYNGTQRLPDIINCHPDDVPTWPSLRRYRSLRRRLNASRLARYPLLVGRVDHTTTLTACFRFFSLKISPARTFLKSVSYVVLWSIQYHTT